MKLLNVNGSWFVEPLQTEFEVNMEKVWKALHQNMSYILLCFVWKVDTYVG